MLGSKKPLRSKSVTKKKFEWRANLCTATASWIPPIWVHITCGLKVVVNQSQWLLFWRISWRLKVFQQCFQIWLIWNFCSNWSPQVGSQSQGRNTEIWLFQNRLLVAGLATGNTFDAAADTSRGSWWHFDYSALWAIFHRIVSPLSTIVPPPHHHYNLIQILFRNFLVWSIVPRQGGDTQFTFYKQLPCNCL